MRCRRYLNRKNITVKIPSDRYRYPENRLHPHRRPITEIELISENADDLTERGVTADEN